MFGLQENPLATRGGTVTSLKEEPLSTQLGNVRNWMQPSVVEPGTGGRLVADTAALYPFCSGLRWEYKQLSSFSRRSERGFHSVRSFFKEADGDVVVSTCLTCVIYLYRDLSGLGFRASVERIFLVYYYIHWASLFFDDTLLLFFQYTGIFMICLFVCMWRNYYLLKDEMKELWINHFVSCVYAISLEARFR